MSSYLLAFSEQLNMTGAVYYFFFGLMIVGGILFAIKKLMSVLQLIGSAQTIAERDAVTPQDQTTKKADWLTYDVCLFLCLFYFSKILKPYTFSNGHNVWFHG